MGQDGQRRPWSSFAILTTEANRLVAQIHNRMPVILHPEDEATWLNPDATPAQAQACLKPFPAQLLRIAAVSPKVNSPANNSPELLQRVDTSEGALREEETEAEAGCSSLTLYLSKTELIVVWRAVRPARPAADTKVSACCHAARRREKRRVSLDRLRGRRMRCHRGDIRVCCLLLRR